MDIFDDDQPQSNVPEFTVSELSVAVKRTLEGEFTQVRVRGEIGRVFRASSGHLYYDIKDARNVLACTTWKGQVAALGVRPEEGLEVIVTGRLSAFGPQSKYNLNVEAMEIAGAGALMALLEKRKTQLTAEGLFASARKKSIPMLPRVIGVITSPQGAVIRDILHRLRDRFPSHVVVWPVAVQGKASAPEVTRAIEGFNALPKTGALPKPDLLIVARGGGSLEDLWGFNEESVVRAAAASDIPLISAVGHETDTTLIDYAADVRAPTPTAAAELAVPVRLDLVNQVRGLETRMNTALRLGIRSRKQRLLDVGRRLPRKEALFATFRQRLDLSAVKLSDVARRSISSHQLALSRLSGQIRIDAVRALIRDKRQQVTFRSQRLHAAPRKALAQAKQQLSGRVERLGQISHRPFRDASHRLNTLGRMLNSLSYRATLARGYAVIWGDGRLITSKAAAQKIHQLEIEFSDGRLIRSNGPKKSVKTRDDDDPDQGALF